MKYRKEEIKAGLVVIAALLIFGVMVIFIGGANFWKKLDIYRIEFSAIGGLEKGASVRLGGLRVGRVSGIAVARDDISKIEVTIGVKPEAPISRGVVAQVQTLGLVGDYYVLLTQKPGANQPLPPESVIPSQKMVEIGDLLVQVADLSQTLNSSVEEVVSAVNQILSEENITSIQTTLQALSRLTAEGEKSVSTITGDLRNVLRGLDTMVADVDSLVLENKKNVQGTLLAIKTSAERLDTLALTLNQTLAENREDLRSTMVAIKQDSQKAGHLIDNLNDRVSITGDYLEETMTNLMEISENLRLLSSQLKRQPWRLIYRGKAKR